MVPRFSRAARLAALGLLLAAIAVGAASCASPLVSGFAWKGDSGSALAFRQSAAFPEGEEGVFGPARLENRYIPTAPFLPPPGSDLELELEIGGSPSARLKLALSSRADGSEAFYSTAITLRESSTRFVLPLEAGREIGSLSLELVPAEAGGPIPELRLSGIASVPAFRGFLRGQGPTRLSPGFGLIREKGRAKASLENPFAFAAAGSLASASRDLPTLLISYGPASLPSDAVLELEAAPGSPFRSRLKSSGGLIRIPLGAFESPPRLLELSLPAGAELLGFYTAALPTAEALLLDLGAILRAKPLEPAEDYSLYRWDLLPEVLVFDFRDYAVQDLYLKRLAFFVEKRGFKGRLASDKEIAPLHGWNAHDYRPEDLAAFFQAAKASDFPLNAEERQLEKLLFERGLIREEGPEIRPGKGALISITRESPPYLRSTFITHEASHALYFADPEFRAFVQAEWASVKAEERWFWKLYFDWMKYDTENEYLIASEYMAYLFQQPLEKAEEYFTSNLPARLLQYHPELAPKLEAYMAAYGRRFETRAARIEAWLGAKYALKAGKAYFLY